VYYGFKPYVPVAERRRRAEHELAKRAKKGHPISPVKIEGRTIARTFWGQAWCDNLERYSDFANRLPRGRTYVRNGSVVDLQVTRGTVAAFVAGSELYEVAVRVEPVPRPRWSALCADCAGGIDSLVELLQGRLSEAVMQRLCARETGLFPAPAEIRLSCSCPDWAEMCKHVAAVLYGIGARLDERPELLFLLREVDEEDLLAKAGTGLPLAMTPPAPDRLLPDEDLSALFGLDLATLDDLPAPAPEAAKPPRRKQAAGGKEAAGRKMPARPEMAARPEPAARPEKPARAKKPPRAKSPVRARPKRSAKTIKAGSVRRRGRDRGRGRR